MQNNETKNKSNKTSNKLKTTAEIQDKFDLMKEIGLPENAQKELLLFIKKHISKNFTKNDKLNILNNLLWEFLLKDKNASAELELTTEKNNGSRFRQVSIDHNLCCIESFEKRIKENGKFENLEEYANEMFKKYGVDVIEYCEYDTFIQMQENKSKYIEKHQGEVAGDYSKKIGYMKDKNFNSFFKRKPIYRSRTDRPLLAVLSQGVIYLELNPLAPTITMNEIIDDLPTGKDRIRSMCDLTKHFPIEDLNDPVCEISYIKQSINKSRNGFISVFENIQTTFERRSIVVESFQCLLCYFIMHVYGIEKYTKAFYAVDYLLTRFYLENDKLLDNEKEEFSPKQYMQVSISERILIAKRRKLTKYIIELLNLGK